MGVQANGSVARFVERRPVSSGGRELEKEEKEIDCRRLRRRGIELEVLLPKRTPDGNQQLTSTPIPEQSLSPLCWQQKERCDDGDEHAADGRGRRVCMRSLRPK